MGDYSDSRDVDRFLRCKSGMKRLTDIRAMFVGKTVAKIDFSNDVDAVLVTISFATGENVEVFMPELMLDALKETFRGEIQEEYFKDYPERRPNPKEGDEKDGEQDES